MKRATLLLLALVAACGGPDPTPGEIEMKRDCASYCGLCGVDEACESQCFDNYLTTRNVAGFCAYDYKLAVNDCIDSTCDCALPYPRVRAECFPEDWRPRDGPTRHENH